MTRTASGQKAAKMKPVLDAGRHPRARYGFIVLDVEETVESDVYRMAPEDVGVHFTRVPTSTAIDQTAIANMVASAADGARLLLPGQNIDNICFTCSAGTIATGEQVILEELATARPDIRVSTVVGCAVPALRAVGARRLAVLTPYPDFLEAPTRRYIDAGEFGVVKYRSMLIDDPSDLVRVSPQYIFEASVDTDQPDADALYICCGALRSLDIVSALEERLGKPVIVSNQAMMWHLLRQSGIDDQLAGYGQLFQR